MNKIKEILLQAPDSQLDASMKSLIEKWLDPPKAIEILEVLDHCINGSLASGFTVSAFTAMYVSALRHEGKTHEELLPLATWRGE